MWFMPPSPVPADPGWDEDPAWLDRDPMTAAEREAWLDRLCQLDDDPCDAPQEYWDPQSCAPPPGQDELTEQELAGIAEAAADEMLALDAIFHSDRSSNYTSAAFALKLSELGIRQSVGRTGICYDNALSESVNGTLKVELVHRTAYATRRQAYDDIARWIELRYNQTRLHSTLGYRTPQEVMDELLEMQAAA
jgi:Integrase core domain